MTRKLRIVFMGTPEFASYCLKELIEHNYNVVGVVTVPDRKKGRGRQIQGSDVKRTAEIHQLKLLQPENLKAADFIQDLKELNPDIIVVVAFRMLPEMVWKLPPKGTFNLHASLLPQYRGAAPINWAIMNGEKETGVTTFFIDNKIDTGEILLQKKVIIEPNDTAGSLHDKLMIAGSKLIMDTIDGIEKENLSPKSQDVSQYPLLKQAPKLFREDCKLNWNEPGKEILFKIRGLSPYPSAWSELKHIETGEILTFKIYKAKLKPEEKNSIPLRIYTDNKTAIDIGTIDGYLLSIEELQLEGKKKLSSEELLRGFDINKYELNC